MNDITVEVMSLGTTKQGKPMKILEVKNDKGEMIKTYIFSWFPDYANIVTGSVIKGKLEQDGQFWKLITAIDEQKKGNPNFRTQQMEKVMEKKEASIEKFQESKNDSIILASTFRDATLLTVAQLGKLTIPIGEKEIEEMWLRWRTWLANNWGDKLSDIQQPF
jgi:hypothetical protein